MDGDTEVKEPALVTQLTLAPVTMGFNPMLRAN